MGWLKDLAALVGIALIVTITTVLLAAIFT